MQLLSIYQIKIILIALSALLISGCGFHFRGDYSVPDQLKTLSVSSHDEYSTLTRLIKNQLKLNDVKLVSPASNIPNLRLVSESTTTQTMSIYQNVSSAETSITLNVSYQVSIPDEGTKSLTTSVNRSYLLNSLTALAKSVEKEMIIDEMRQIAATRVIRQLARLQNDEATSSSKSAQDPETNIVTSTTVVE
jgi:LPS-assembly lipoprotein